MSVNLITVAAIVLSLLVSTVAITFGTMASIRKKQNETEVGRLIIENNTDPETAKVLTANFEQNKSTNIYDSLRGACVLIGIGIGTLINYLLCIKGIIFWLIIAFGLGLGVFISSLIEIKLRKQDSIQ